MHRTTTFVETQEIPRQATPTLAEVAQARPHRGCGAPARCASHKSAILALLRERGPQGVLSSELYDSPEKFGRSPRNRISELRAEGCLISGEPRGASDWHYVLLRDSEGVPPKPCHPWSKPFSAKRLADDDWYVRQSGHPRPSGKPTEQPADDLPLFAEHAK